MQSVLLIRADASIAMGTGHVMRMIALGQAWQDKGGKVMFLCAEITPQLEQRIREEDFRIKRISAAPGSAADLEVTTAAVSRNAKGGRSVAVVLDGYQFGSDFQLGVKKAGCRLMAVDDYGHADAYYADIVLNQNISAREGLYARSNSSVQLLLGPSFALLRREFADHRGWVRAIPNEAKKLLVTLGGADADNVTKKVLDAVAGSGFEVKVVVGGSNPHLPELRQAAEAATRGETRVELVVNASDMRVLMQWADMAVASGGSTSWELAFTGLPSMFMILADNQEENARQLERQGCGLCLGKPSTCDVNRLRTTFHLLGGHRELRASFASRGQELVDGKGSERISKFLDFRSNPATTD
jgi:UDP-2,4-diacetamido-2,4,6-trideoxy-beta-L-altropyranose hydrolase